MIVETHIEKRHTVLLVSIFRYSKLISIIGFIEENTARSFRGHNGIGMWKIKKLK